jgi:hypothetical protein
MPETWTLPLMAVGGGLLLFGLLWLLVVAFRTGFIKRAFLPVLVVLLGVAVAGFIPVYNTINQPPVQTTAQVFGDSITITGAKKDQLAVVLGHKGWKTIQAANAGLTDEELTGLDGMSELGFLDLNDNPVTDATLERLVKLPKLTKLFVARTKITPEGVAKHVLTNPDCRLTELDLTGLNVPGKDIRDWKNADKNRKVNQ